ncbi:MAG TPA: hypothetical protein VKF38_10560 [Anaerolineaceae bacterium]|nr:hypothetical protein [Anaerolineaceae bacterium]
MHLLEEKRIVSKPIRHYGSAGGIVLIVFGLIILLDQYLKTGWLTLVVFPSAGLILLVLGIIYHRMGLVIPGSIISGMGIGGFLYFSPLVTLAVQNRVGFLFLAFSLGWMGIAILGGIMDGKIAWWAFLCGCIFGSLGACFLFTSLRVVDFGLYLSVGLGLSFLTWGIARRLFGLVIPGCLVLGAGSGVYMAWGKSIEVNELAKTGLFLVCFALAWLLITICSKVITDKFVWWPLIPGGVIAMVGWGLYIGGNPGNAVNFIGNTTSIGLILFGLYLLLLRQGIHR